jgi:phosphatidylserine/phosphatidylglycerophosphate/cardiolipin synthase-like enzyme
MEAIWVLISVGVGVVLGEIAHQYIKNQDVLEDRNIGEKLGHLPGVLRMARKNIKIATDFDKGFFGSEEVQKIFEEAIGRGVEIKILSERDPLPWYKNQKEIKIKRMERLPYHIWVIDQRHVRLERPHPGRSFGIEKGDIALIYKNYPILAEKYDKAFDELWNQ